MRGIMSQSGSHTPSVSASHRFASVRDGQEEEREGVIAFRDAGLSVVHRPATGFLEQAKALEAVARAAE
jgi:hypothetical protein